MTTGSCQFIEILHAFWVKMKSFLKQIKAPTRWHCVTLQVQAFVQSQRVNGAPAFSHMIDITF